MTQEYEEYALGEHDPKAKYEPLPLYPGGSLTFESASGQVIAGPIPVDLVTLPDGNVVNAHRIEGVRAVVKGRQPALVIDAPACGMSLLFIPMPHREAAEKERDDLIAVVRDKQNARRTWEERLAKLAGAPWNQPDLMVRKKAEAAAVSDALNVGSAVVPAEKMPALLTACDDAAWLVMAEQKIGVDAFEAQIKKHSAILRNEGFASLTFGMLVDAAQVCRDNGGTEEGAAEAARQTACSILLNADSL